MNKSYRAVDKTSIVPLYHQVKEYLKNQIGSNVYKVDEMIPSERELSEQFEINRLTVRQAINELVQEGLLYRQRGVGTFVAMPKIEQPLTKLTNFSSDMHSRGLAPGAQVVSMEVIPASKPISMQLQIPEGEQVIELVRVRTANGEPLALERSYLVYELAHGLYEMNMENASLYQMLEDICGLKLVKALQTIEVSTARQDEAGILDIGQHDPVMLIERTTFTEGSNRPVEYVRSLYRGDRYKFSIEMKV
ncbi:GntR family transcriptional regulator [Gorillibacterium timonense]|uniref:GntR family transcriptional regulator n=1 Tax=Gorillibacterium timonense TaxID=1689269 RepID=UPI00071C9F7A|nr:GntR family transcriptional regulator [Gorillibacterium timonense]